MAKTRSSNEAVRSSVQKAFRNKRNAGRNGRTRTENVIAARMPTSRLMKGNIVVMSKTNDEAENDLSMDIAGAVGKTVGNIVNRIEALDGERAELIRKLADARNSLNDQFSKWLPAGYTATATPKANSKKQRKTSGKPCAICHISGHDGRHHRNHPGRFTKEELRARNLPTGD